MINILKKIIRYILAFIIMFLFMYLLCYCMLLYITINRTPEVYYAINIMSCIAGVLFVAIQTLVFWRIPNKNKKLTK